jgi:fatty-acyl-CoA synthase
MILEPGLKGDMLRHSTTWSAMMSDLIKPASTSYADVFDLVAATVDPGSPAVICDGEWTDWQTFHARSDALAGALLRRGLAPGSKVALYMRNGADYLIAFAACFKARLVSVNINYRYGPGELSYLLSNADAEAVIFDAEFSGTLEKANSSTLKQKISARGSAPEAEAIEKLYAEAPQPLPAGRSGDDIFLLYTGGTTGMPKGVMWPSQSMWEALASARRAGLNDPSAMTLEALAVLLRGSKTQPAYYIAPPVMHGTGLFSAVSVLSRGGAVVCSAAKSFDATAALRAIEAHRCSGVVIVGDAFARPIVDALDAAPGAFDLTCVEAIVSSGMMWSHEAKQGLLKHMPGAVLSDGLGASEASSIAFSVTTKDIVPEAARFSPVDVIVVDPETFEPVEAGSGKIGVIAKAGALPLGYYKDPERTASTYSIINGIRRMISGDHARLEADGTITLLGRGNHCINTAGEKVYPEEVEEVLKQFPGIIDALVFGETDPRLGQRVVAIVSRKADTDHEELTAFARQKLAGYKVPKSIKVVDQVPRGPNGKADYPSARGLFLEK